MSTTAEIKATMEKFIADHPTHGGMPRSEVEEILHIDSQHIIGLTQQYNDIEYESETKIMEMISSENNPFDGIHRLENVIAMAKEYITKLKNIDSKIFESLEIMSVYNKLKIAWECIDKCAHEERLVAELEKVRAERDELRKAIVGAPEPGSAIAARLRCGSSTVPKLEDPISTDGTAGHDGSARVIFDGVIRRPGDAGCIL